MKASLAALLVLALFASSMAQSSKCKEITLEQSGFVFCLINWTPKLGSRDTKPHYFSQRTADFFRSLVISEFGFKSSTHSEPVQMFSDLILKQRRHHKLIKTTDFETASGLVGTKFTTDSTQEWGIDREMRSVFYCFEGPRDLKLMFELRFPLSDTMAEEEIDKALKALRPDGSQ